jgi:hypothetical protein
MNHFAGQVPRRGFDNKLTDMEMARTGEWSRSPELQELASYAIVNFMGSSGIPLANQPLAITIDELQICAPSGSTFAGV